MQSSTKLGTNRTGAQMSPLDIKKMQQGSMALTGSGGEIESPPQSLIREQAIAEADRIGSVPIPASVDGVVDSITEVISGHRPQVFIDKLGERLAFERSGVRLYEALLTKCVLCVTDLPSDMIDRLSRFKEEELLHFKLVHEAMEEIGADPTAVTPCADLAGVEGSGLVKAVSDARTTVLQSLHAILSAELIDNAGWEGLIDLAQQLKLDDMVLRFEPALAAEEEHLAQIKTWVLDLMSAEALREHADSTKH